MVQNINVPCHNHNNNHNKGNPLMKMTITETIGPEEMRFVWFFAFILVSTFVYISAYVGPKSVEARMYEQNILNKSSSFYKAPHELRKIFVRDEEISVKKPGSGHLSGGFFLFLGGISGSYEEGTETKHSITRVRFAWEIKDNT